MMLHADRSRPMRRAAAVLALLAGVGCEAITGGGDGERALAPGVYQSIGPSIPGTDLVQWTVLPDGAVRLFARAGCTGRHCTSASTFLFADDVASQRQRGGTPLRMPGTTSFGVAGLDTRTALAVMRGDSIVLSEGGERYVFRRVSTSTEPAAIARIDTRSLFLPATVRLAPTVRTAADLVLPQGELDVEPRFLFAVDAHGVYWSAPQLGSRLHVEVPEGWTVAGTVLRSPARESEGTVRFVADTATASFTVRALRDLRAVPFTFTYSCLRPAGTPALDSVRVEGTARFSYADEPTSTSSPPPGAGFSYTGTQRRYRTDGGVDTVVASGGLFGGVQAPGVFSQWMNGSTLTPVLFEQPGARPLRFAGAPPCSAAIDPSSRALTITEVLP